MHPTSIANAIAVATVLFPVACVLIAIIIANERNKRAKLEFLRSAMERGAQLNPELIDKIMRPGETAASKRALPRGQGTLVAGIIVIALGVGYAILTYCISLIARSALIPMVGVTSLILCMGIGLLVVSRVLRSGSGATGPEE